MRGLRWAEPRISPRDDGRRWRLALRVAHFGLAIASICFVLDLQPGSAVQRNIRLTGRVRVPYRPTDSRDG
eukprot:scaffold253007_cov20-Prasinocladus_malaysianus.AAC.1